ncbi:MAG: hypothetical protein [Bacteriophage sp.]|nr:MAG: hypothetical protein [Bacteriophage sp.]
MASWKPELYNADEVLNYYDNSDAVQYRVYAGTKPDPAYLRYAFDATDKGEKAEGSQQLQMALQKILNSPMNTNPYLLEIVRGQGKGKKPITTNITFQLNQLPQMQPAGWNGIAGYQQQTSPELLAVLKQLSDQNSLIISKLSTDEVDTDGDDVGSVPVNPIMAMLNQPQIQAVLAAKLGDLLGKVFNTGDSNKAAMLNGTIQDDQIRQAIDILKKHDPNIGESLLKLAQLAESNPAYFTQLITMLKSM